MFCPTCKDEFVPGITECPDCKVPLVMELSVENEPSPEPVYVGLFNVMESGDPGLIMVANSLLEDAGIRYCAKATYAITAKTDGIRAKTPFLIT